MVRWLCISTRENDRIAQLNNIWGVANRFLNPISRVKIGDTLLMYTMKEILNREILPSAITGEYLAVSEVFLDEKSIFKSTKYLRNENFPLRIKIKTVNIFKVPIQFKPLIPNLSFIKNKKMWSGSIRTAMREIPEEDYRQIIAAELLGPH